MEKIQYRVIRSNRKSAAIQIKTGGEVLVRVPNWMGQKEIEEIVESRRDWIEKHLPQEAASAPKFTDTQMSAMAQRAKTIIPERVAHFAPLVGVTYGRITIRNQRTRWGSCSSQGNLNFNCLLMLAPDDVIDYVVVHELCHRKEMNHSEKFWAEVERVIPDWKVRRRWLKEHGGALMERMVG